MEKRKMDFSKLKLRSKDKNDSEDLSDWSGPEMVALVLHYFPVSRSYFVCTPKTTLRVKQMKLKYPKAQKARPIGMGKMVALAKAKGKEHKAHALDASPAVEGRNFATISLPDESAVAAYTIPSSVTKIVETLSDGEIDKTKLSELTPKIVCRHGIASLDVDPDVARQQRVAAVCQSLVSPGNKGRGLVPAITAVPKGFEGEVLTTASALLGAVFSDIEGKAQEHQIFDTMTKDAKTYEYVAQTVGEGLQDTVYAQCTGEYGELIETSEPPKYEKLQAPIAAVVSLIPTIHPRTIGKVAANVVDGFPACRSLRVRMNKLADVHVPDGACVVYLDQPDRNLATQILRREKGRKVVVFFKATQFQRNLEMEDHFETVEQGGKTLTKVKKAGVLPHFGEFVSPIPSRTLYVDANKTTAANVTAKTMVEGCQDVKAKDKFKFNRKPETKWFMIKTHVYSLNPDLYTKGGTTEPAYGRYFYVSRNFQSCNVLNTNYKVKGLTALTRSAVVDMFVHLLRCALSYPITRVPCMAVQVGRGQVQLIPSVAYYPFSGRIEIAAALAVLKRSRNVPVVSTFGSNVKQAVLPRAKDVPVQVTPQPAEEKEEEDVPIVAASPKIVCAVQPPPQRIEPPEPKIPKGLVGLLAPVPKGDLETYEDSSTDSDFDTDDDDW